MNPKQCKSKDFLKDLECQGCPKHKGPHWAYDEAGHLIQWKNEKEKDPEWKHIACKWLPPGSKGYISPEKMDKYYYLTIWAEEKRRNDKNVKH